MLENKNLLLASQNDSIKLTHLVFYYTFKKMLARNIYIAIRAFLINNPNA